MSEPGDGRFEAMVEAMRGGVTPNRPGMKTWVYRPAGPQMTVTVSARRGLRIALRLFWESLIALLHRDTVTFEASEDLPPFSIEILR